MKPEYIYRIVRRAMPDVIARAGETSTHLAIKATLDGVPVSKAFRGLEGGANLTLVEALELIAIATQIIKNVIDLFERESRDSKLTKREIRKLIDETLDEKFGSN